MLLPDLSIFAEVSVAILGFSGLVSTLDRVKESSRAFMVPRLKSLMFISGCACLASLAPLTGLDLQYCAAMFAFLVAWVLYSVSRDFAPSKGAAPSLFLVFFAVGIAVAGVGFQLYALTLAPHLLVNAYVYSICGCLSVAIIFFIRMVLAMIHEVDE